MQITVSGQQMEVTEPLRNYASDKISRIQRHFDSVTNTNIVLHIEKNFYMAEGTIYGKGVTLHAYAEDSNMYAAIDSLADKLDRQILKHKEKTTNHNRNDELLKKYRTL